MRILLVIPARAGSRSIPGKNLRKVKGLPLIAYAIRNALAASRVNKVIVSTEDEEIAKVARSFGAETPYMRPGELAGDEISLIPVVQHAAQAMANDHGYDADAVASLQPTAPLLKPERIDAAIEIMRSSNCDSVTTVQKIGHFHPYHALKLAEGGRTDPLFPDGDGFLQKQDLPDLFARTGGLYLHRPKLLENWSGTEFCLGRDARAIVVDPQEALDIDYPLDLEVFKVFLDRRLDH